MNEDRPFAITVDRARTQVPPGRTAEIGITVSNVSGRRLVARPSVHAPDAQVASWVNVDQPHEQDLDEGETRRLAARIEIPASISPGTYTCRIIVSNVENPDEEFAEGPDLTIEVTADAPAPERKPFPWWIVAVAGGAVLLIGIIVTVVVLTSGGDGGGESEVAETPAPAPAAAAAPGEAAPLVVQSIEHANGSVGAYFHFTAADLDEILGRSDWAGKTHPLGVRSGGGDVVPVVMWRSPNGGSSGDAHGRKADGAKNGDWTKGQELTFGESPALAQHPIEVLSNDHSSGKTGQYFNFDVAEVDKAVGHDQWARRVFTIRQARTGKSSAAVLWRNANGGSQGDGHGRWVDGPAPGQWKAGETFEIRFVHWALPKRRGG